VRDAEVACSNHVAPTFLSADTIRVCGNKGQRLRGEIEPYLSLILSLRVLAWRHSPNWLVFLATASPVGIFSFGCLIFRKSNASGRKSVAAVARAGDGGRL